MAFVFLFLGEARFHRPKGVTKLSVFDGLLNNLSNDPCLCNFENELPNYGQLSDTVKKEIKCMAVLSLLLLVRALGLKYLISD